MSVTLRVLLIVFCLITFIYIQRKIKKSKFKIEESMFWIAFSTMLLVISIYPRLVRIIADIMGISAMFNCLYLILIFLLIVKVFQLSKKNSDLEDKFKQLTQTIAIMEKERREKEEMR